MQDVELFVSISSQRHKSLELKVIHQSLRPAGHHCEARVLLDMSG